MNKTEAARRKAKWLAGCLKTGWLKSDLDELSAVWDKFRDENGNDRKPPLPDEQGDAIGEDVQKKAERYAMENCRSCNDRHTEEGCSCSRLEAAYLAGAQSVGADKLAAWNMALILANNECVRMSDDYNKDDEIDRASAASDCAKIIRGYINNPIPELATLLSPSQPGSQEVTFDEAEFIKAWGTDRSAIVPWLQSRYHITRK